MEQASAAENFIERMGLISQVDGAPRIAGRILGLLIVEGRPFTLDEMAERLKISKASASTNARQLRASGIIRLVAHAGDRHDYYELGSDPYRRSMETISERLASIGSEVIEAAASFPEGQAEAKRRVCQFGRFYLRMGERLKAWSEQVEDEADTTTN
ncbi:hypothetical protein VE25_03760 [Devosia geojensis]|uniref:HTH marR-type domain-containing protein n=1 Tax=Devosia geojensis TaxID=443610 RepID=A0A0F5FW85_9HYPH|nr:MarR family transcriptional regulator [Devosia geojensis]KKB13078.1 hypothetical protein VE25_03760 [Devosia geojensis]